MYLYLKILHNAEFTLMYPIFDMINLLHLANKQLKVRTYHIKYQISYIRYRVVNPATVMS